MGAQLQCCTTPTRRTEGGEGTGSWEVDEGSILRFSTLTARRSASSRFPIILRPQRCPRFLSLHPVPTAKSFAHDQRLPLPVWMTNRTHLQISHRKIIIPSFGRLQLWVQLSLFLHCMDCQVNPRPCVCFGCPRQSYTTTRSTSLELG